MVVRNERLGFAGPWAVAEKEKKRIHQFFHSTVRVLNIHGSWK